MALLTNPNPGDGKLTKILLKNKKIIYIVLYFSGIVWFLSLAHKTFNEGTYFSENALLPGLVRGEFDEENFANKLFIELREIMQSNPNQIPSTWLIQKFHEITLDAYIHRFNLTNPLSNNSVSKTYQGENVYAILRAPRSSNTEGLVVTAPFRTFSSAHAECTASIALIFALAKFCRKQKYWAKDIIFLITDHEQLGTQAWLQAYHNINLGNGVIQSGNIDARAGSLQAAINLEIYSSRISHIDVKVEGLNGQLPNLDLVNLVHKLCKNEGINHTFKNRNNPKKKDTSVQQWFHSLLTLTSMVFTQASCVPNGNHGLYHRFGIEAVTLEGHQSSPHSRKQIFGFYQIGRILEGILRSLNNLLERFHQSYFFYLLPSNDRFIPIGSYMPSISLIGIPLLIKGLTIWIKLYNHFKPRILNKNRIKVDEYSMNKVVSETDKKAENIKFLRIGTSFLISHLAGWFFTSCGVWLSIIGFNLLGLSSKNSIYTGFLIFFCATLFIPYFFSFNAVEFDILNITALLELATLLLIIAMHNFSLSFILGILYVPCVCFFSFKSSRSSGKFLNSIYLLFVHPYVLVHEVVAIYTFLTHEDNFFLKAFSATQNSLVYLIIDEMIYSNWLIKAVFGFLLSNWVLFWIHLRAQLNIL